MIIDVKFNETNATLDVNFGESLEVIDGYDKGYVDGYDKGLATRTYEVWTITLTNGEVIEKEIALL